MKVFAITLAMFIHFVLVGKIQAQATPDFPKDSIYQIHSKWINQDGKSIELSEFAGKPMVVSMVYLTCKHTCPITVAHMKELEKLLDEDLKSKVQFVLVSIDPRRDTPAVMKAYAEKNKLDTKAWSFITTKKDQDIRELSGVIDFKYKKLPDGEFEHSLGLIAIDEKGIILGSSIGARMKESEMAKLFKVKKGGE